MKKLVKTSIVALLTCALAACSAPADEPDPVPTPTPGTSKTVQIWLIRDGREHDTRVLRKLRSEAARFDRVYVRVEMIPADQIEARLQQARAAGWSPDVVEMPSDRVIAVAREGQLFDLLPAVEDLGVQNDQMIAMQRAAEYDGGLFGVPFSMTAPAMVYNKEIFAQAGITQTPKTWDELVRAADLIKQARPDIDPWPVSTQVASSIYPFLLTTGDELANFDGQSWHSELATPAAVDGLSRYASRVTASTANQSSEQLATAIAQGRAGMAVLTSRDVREVLRVNPKMDTKLGVFAIPGTDGHAAPVIVDSTHLVIPEGSDGKQYAWDIARRMSTSSFSIEWNQRQGGYAGMKSLLDQQIENSTSIEKPFARPLVERGMPEPTSPAWRQIEDQRVIPAMVEAVVSGQQSAQQAAAQAAARIEQTLNDAK